MRSYSIFFSLPRLAILATSRTALNMMGDHHPVPPLEIMNPDDHLPLTNLVQCESVRLFSDRATAVRPNFALTEKKCARCMRICQLLDGIPLPIELAAVRSKVLNATNCSAAG
jgi:non-specific serine/threonine protein kinase